MLHVNVRCATGVKRCADATTVPRLGLPQCYGRTGAEVLDSMHANYDAFSSKDEIATSLLALLAIALVVKLECALVLHARCRLAPPPRPPFFV